MVYRAATKLLSQYANWTVTGTVIINRGAMAICGCAMPVYGTRCTTGRDQVAGDPPGAIKLIGALSRQSARGRRSGGAAVMGIVVCRCTMRMLELRHQLLHGDHTCVWRERYEGLMELKDGRAAGRKVANQQRSIILETLLYQAVRRRRMEEMTGRLEVIKSGLEVTVALLIGRRSAKQ